MKTIPLMTSVLVINNIINKYIDIILMILAFFVFLRIPVVYLQLSGAGLFIILSVLFSLVLFTFSSVIRTLYLKRSFPTLELKFLLWDLRWYLPTIILSVTLGTSAGGYILGISDIYVIMQESFDCIWKEGGIITYLLVFPLGMLILTPWLPYYEKIKMLGKKGQLVTGMLIVIYTFIILYLFLSHLSYLEYLSEGFLVYDKKYSKFVIGSVYIGWLYLALKAFPAIPMQNGFKR